MKRNPLDEPSDLIARSSTEGAGLNIYCYWPHPHAVASRLMLNALRDGDRLTVQALPSLRGNSFGGVAEYEIVRDLPDPTALTQSGLAGRPLRAARLVVSRSRARRRLLRRDFDVGHIELLSPYSDWLDLRGVRRRLPLVSTVHDVRPHRSASDTIEARLLRRLYRDDRAGHLIVYHETLKQELVSDFSVEAERVSILPHPLDGRDLRDRTVAKPNRPYALVFGTLRTNKGIPVLLEAIRSLGKGADFDVIVAGGEGDPELAAQLVEASRLLPRLKIELGFVSAERKRELFSTASLVVLPYTRFHSQSGVLADAYAYRVPLLVTDVGALGETVRLDRTGWVVPPSDADALASVLVEAMDAVAAGVNRADELDAAARRHDYSVVGPALREVYELVVSKS